MSANPKFVTLLHNVLDATEKGNLEWEETPAEEGYRVLLNRIFVHVHRSYDELREHVSYGASLVDSNGKSLEWISSDDIDNAEELRLLTDVFDAARRRALNVDGLLDGLIQAVNKKM